MHFVTGEPKQTPVQDTIFKNIEVIFIIESQTRMIIIVNFVTRKQKQIPNTCTIFKIMIITFNIVNLHQKKKHNQFPAKYSQLKVIYHNCETCNEEIQTKTQPTHHFQNQVEIIFYIIENFMIENPEVYSLKIQFQEHENIFIIEILQQKTKTMCI